MSMPQPQTHLSSPNALKRQQAGFTVVAAIAILVILSLLGAFILNISGGQAQTLALDLLSSRAYQAARAGIEWNAYRIYNPEADTTAPYTTAYDCSTPITPLSGLSNDLAGFTVTVSCSMTSHTEFGNAVRVFQIVSKACNDPANGVCPNNDSTNSAYVERQITAVFGTCRLPSTDAPC